MTTITYRDLNEDAPRITWCGVKFLDGQPVEVNDPVLIRKAKNNPFFTIDGGKRIQEKSDEQNQDRTGDTGPEHPRKGSGRSKSVG